MKAAHTPRFVAILPLLFALGCGGDKRRELHGSVSFKGQPVPYGMIYFDPDTSKGNGGPQASAEIQAGVYKTLPGFGTIGGPHRVRVLGFDASPGPGSGGAPVAAKPLFPEYVASIEVPAQGGTLDIEVPGR